jgi:hypothetical protein
VSGIFEPEAILSAGERLEALGATLPAREQAALRRSPC